MKPSIHLITGYLGSGKTLFLSRLLERHFVGERIAVIVNDFGDVVYDGLLLNRLHRNTSPNYSPVQILDVPGGCLCCSAIDDFKTALTQVLTSTDDHESCTRVFIEATGLADAAQVRADLAFMGFPVDSTLCIVDVVNIQRMRSLFPTIDEQIAVADVVLFAKIDIATRTAVEAAHTLVRSLNDRAVVAYLKHGAVAADLLTVLFAPAQHFVPTAHNSQQHLLRDEITAFRLVTTIACDRSALEYCFAGLPANVVRIKGVVRFADEEYEWQLVNFVCGRWEFHPLEDQYLQRSELFVIGRRLDESMLMRWFDGVMTAIETGTVQNLRIGGIVEHNHEHHDVPSL